MIDNMVKTLNELLEADPLAAGELFHLSVSVNKQVCDHPTIQVREGSRRHLSLLGLLNGMLGGDRVIVMMTGGGETANDAGEIIGFTTGTLKDGKVTPDAAG